MKKSNIIISGSVAVVVLMAATGIAMTTLAAETVASSSTETSQRGHRQMLGFDKNLNLTDAQITEMKAKREADKTARETSRLAVQAALDLGDYNAWLKVVPKDSPILSKINQDNFPKLVEAHKLMKQSGDIMKELGIERGDMMGGKMSGPRGDRGQK